MALLTRNTLKNLFKRGMVPSEVNFSDLIDSTINKVDDGFSQSNKDGFMLAPQGPNHKLISFFESIRDPHPSFSLSLNPNTNQSGLSINNEENQSILFLKSNGNVGIGTTNPAFRLDVHGMAGMGGRVGTYAVGEIPADGRWHALLTDLEGVQAFEIMAHAAGRLGRGKYALSHAIALSTYGQGSIRHIKASYGFFWRKISFRWTGSENSYRLEARTAANYGFLDQDEKKPVMLRYWITKLWDDSSMLPKGMTTSLDPSIQK